MRQTISEAAPGAAEAISYQMPTFKLNGNLVHFAAYKQHIGFYPTPSGIEAFREELSPYPLSKGAIRFPLGEPLPVEPNRLEPPGCSAPAVCPSRAQANALPRHVFAGARKPACGNKPKTSKCRP
jgi:hypothetical protein